jgi:hypothetical protein
MSAMLKMLDDGNKGSGGLGKPKVFFGIAGWWCLFDVCVYQLWLRQASFVLLRDGTWCWYRNDRWWLCLEGITYITVRIPTSYQCVPIRRSKNRQKNNVSWIYSSKLTCQRISTSGSLYHSSTHSSTHSNVFSYTYDLTSTLQHNLTATNRSVQGKWPFNDRFAWNFHLLTAPFTGQDGPAVKPHWLLPLVHGHVDQASK